MTLAGVLRIRQIRCFEQVEDNVAAIAGAKPLISSVSGVNLIYWHGIK